MSTDRTKQPALPDDLAGKSVIVTGGSRGIGRGLALVLGRAGVRLMITGRKPERLEAVSQELDAADVTHRVRVADVADRAAGFALAEETLEAFGRIDGLLANASPYDP